MDRIRVLDREFRRSIRAGTIRKAVKDMASRMNRDLREKQVIFMGILNGSFIFASDLFRQIDFDCQITFLKLASYQGTTSSGNVLQLIGINEDIRDHTVVILEDIVDTGYTMDSVIKQLKEYEPKEIKIATLLFKPQACCYTLPLDYVGIEIPNDFVIGYGLDYNGFGRNLQDIYTVVK